MPSLKQPQPDIPGKTYEALDGNERHLEIFVFVASEDGRVSTGDIKEHIEISRQRTQGHLRDMRDAEVLQSISEGRENQWEVRDEHDPQEVLERPKIQTDGGYGSPFEFLRDYDDLVTGLAILTLFAMLASAAQLVGFPLGSYPDVAIGAAAVAWVTISAVMYTEVYR